MEDLCKSLDQAIRQKVHDNLRATASDLDHLQRVGRRCVPGPGAGTCITNSPAPPLRRRRLATARTKARARSAVGFLWMLAMLVAVPLPVALLTTHVRGG